MKVQAISPLKDSPFRNPGQSLQEKIDNIFDGKVIKFIIAPVLFIYAVGMTWWYKHTNEVPNPILLIIMASGITIYSILRIYTLRKQVKKLKQARDGKKAVGQYLENFRVNGDRVFHDIIGDEFNLDHVIVSKHGIFIVETKTYSKPKGIEPEIIYSKKSIKVNGFDTKDKLLIQAVCEAKWLKKMLNSSTGKEFPIKTVIAFPGWFIKDKENQNSTDIWVLNPKVLPKFILNNKEILTPEDRMLVSYHISRFIRSNTLSNCQ